jgi:hypothetical protein
LWYHFNYLSNIRIPAPNMDIYQNIKTISPLVSSWRSSKNQQCSILELDRVTKESSFPCIKRRCKIN